MRLAEDQVERFGMPVDDRAHGVDRVFETFAAIDETEGRNDRTSFESEPTFRNRRFAKRDVRDAVMDDADLGRIGTVAFDEYVAAGFREHDDGVGRFADGARDAPVIRRGVGQDGVQRNDRRLCDRRKQVNEPFAVFTAEETVLVLKIHRRARIGVHQQGDVAVGGAVVLPQARDHAAGIAAVLAARFVDRDNARLRTEALVVRIDDIRREGRDTALTRRKRPDEQHSRRSV